MVANSYPSTAFRFQVELDGLLVAGFSEVMGLEAETEVEIYHEGGVNDFEHRFIKVQKHPNLVLRRGITNSLELWNWYEGVAMGTITRKNGSIILLDASGSETLRWNFFNSFPVKWVGPQLRAVSSEVAIETLEIVHQGLKTIAGS
ncbi:MAG: phage tail protein [Syntrophomonadaceae bacterium]|nr:phage tail protein [Syntrophomonadaceae bacterium]